jgi:hypothetical protein
MSVTVDTITLTESTDDFSISKCTGECRLLDVSGDGVIGHKLQQKWSVVQYKDNMIWKQHDEWRDVPIVSLSST